MRRALSLALGILLVCLPCRSQGLDSLTRVKLDGKLEEYFSVLQAQSTDVKSQECDYILSSCQSGEVRDYVARRLYAHFMESHIMGDEAVVIHLYDKWFSEGKTKFADEIELLNAGIYADFNRQSLIGCMAPSLALKTPEGKTVEALGNDGDGHASESERYRILYFYSPDCSKCKVESPMLRDLLSKKEYPVEAILVDTGDNRDEWDSYREGTLGIRTSVTEVRHYWDPVLDSDFQRKYGVLQTPRMFLVDTRGKIVARGIGTSELRTILDSLFGDDSLEYGTPESKAFYDKVFGEIPSLQGEDVKHVARGIVKRSAGISNVYRQMSGDLLYYLTSKGGKAYKEGALFVIDSLILSKPGIWRTRDDTLKVVEMARLQKTLLSKSPVGTKVAPIQVHGTLRNWKGEKEGLFRLDGIRCRNTFIVIYDPHCTSCEAEMAGISAYIGAAHSKDRAVRREARSTKFLLLDMEKLSKDHPQEAEKLLEAFDLSSLPYITLLDRNGIVKDKYLSFSE